MKQKTDKLKKITADFDACILLFLTIPQIKTNQRMALPIDGTGGNANSKIYTDRNV